MVVFEKRCNISEFHTVETELLQINEESLIKALKELGFNPKIHEKAKNLYGYRADQRDQVAHIILPREQVGTASNDIGFERLDNGKYQLHVSEFDQRSWSHKMPKLIQQYGINTIESFTSTSDYSMVEQEVESDGTIRIRLRVNDY